MTILDDLDKINKLDKSNLYKHILVLPNKLQASYNDLLSFKLPKNFKNAKNVVIGGMGGSGVAASVVHDLVDFKVPLETINDYNLPRWARENTLVVLVSHSGFTEEVLSLYKEARTRTGNIFVISEGDNGELEKLTKKDGGLFYDYDSQVPPRFSLGEQLGSLLGLFDVLGLIDNKLEINKSVDFCNNFNKSLGVSVETENNLAKGLAFRIFDHVLVMVASGMLKTVSYRWQTQANENGKNFAYHLVFPEAAHNAVTGIGWPKRSKDDLFFMLLKNKTGNAHTQKRIDLFAELLDRERVGYEKHEALGEGALEKVLSTVLLGDWVSYYLGILNNVDPGEIENIEWIKSQIKI